MLILFEYKIFKLKLFTFAKDMRKFLFIYLILISGLLHSQTKIQGTEFGLDGYFSASNFSGNLGIGVKYGFLLSENFIIGPSLRYQRVWVKNFGDKYVHNIFGGGIFAHYRFLDYLFVGTEIEIFKSPLNYGSYFGSKQTIATAFVGGGFSHLFSQIRINAGIFYDVIDSLNSPFRQGYQVKNKQNGALVPIIYRIGIFIPLS